MVDLRSAAVKKYWRGGRLENGWSMVKSREGLLLYIWDNKPTSPNTVKI